MELTYQFAQWLISEHPVAFCMAVVWLPWPLAFAVYAVTDGIRLLIVELAIVVLGRRTVRADATDS